MWIKLSLFLLFALPISIADIKWGRIPDALSLSAAAVIAAYLAFFEPSGVTRGIAGAVFCFAFLWTVRAATKGLGLGDVKYALAIGLACGPTLSFFALIFASAAALLIAGPLLALGKITNKTKLPFGPFLSLGAIISLSLGAAGVLKESLPL